MKISSETIGPYKEERVEHTKRECNLCLTVVPAISHYSCYVMFAIHSQETTKMNVYEADCSFSPMLMIILIITRLNAPKSHTFNTGLNQPVTENEV